MGDGALDVHTPEALVYEPVGPGKGLRLAAVEYVVLKAAWDAEHNGAPVMFGRSVQLHAGGEPLRLARVLLAARVALQAQPERSVLDVEPP